MSDSLDSPAPRPARPRLLIGILFIVIGSCIGTGYFALFHIDRTIYTETNASDDPLIADFLACFNIQSIRYTHDVRLHINRYVFLANVDYSAAEFRELAEAGATPNPIFVEESSEVGRTIEGVPISNPRLAAARRALEETNARPRAFFAEEPTQIARIVQAVSDADPWKKDGLGWDKSSTGSLGVEFSPEDSVYWSVAYIPNADNTDSGRLVGWIYVSWDDGDS